MLLVLLSLLFWSLLETQSQTPYLSFKDKNLPNNSYVDIREIGMAEDGNDSVQCISELDYCCNNHTSKLVTDWYFPDGTRLNFSSGFDDIYEARGTHTADLRRRKMDNSTTGIYCCRVPFSVSNPRARKMLCVGIYYQGGELLFT